MYTTYEWAHACTHKHTHKSNRHRHLYNNTIMSDELSGMGSRQPVTLPWFRGREHCCAVKHPAAQSITSCACARHASLSGGRSLTEAESLVPGTQRCGDTVQRSGVQGVISSEGWQAPEEVCRPLKPLLTGWQRQGDTENVSVIVACPRAITIPHGEECCTKEIHISELDPQREVWKKLVEIAETLDNHYQRPRKQSASVPLHRVWHAQ